MLQKITHFLEMLSLVAFLVAYKMHGLIYGTKVLMICSSISLICTFVVNKKITWNQVIPVILVLVLGGITVVSNNSTFIKIKPTIVYSLFSLVLLGGLICKKLFIQKILGAAFVMDDNHWRKLTIAWVVFFASCAGLNEIVWRNFSEQTWVMFKVFAFIPLSLCFIIGQMVVLRHHLKK